MVEYPIVLYDAPIWTVYMHVNKINNKKYVGVTSKKPQSRWGKNGNLYNSNKSRHTVFYDAIQKYGWDNFDHIILLSHCTQIYADIMERVLIKYYNSHVSTKQGYNIYWGGLYHQLKKRGSDNPMAKKVVCLNTGTIYGSCVEAGKKTGISKNNIGNVCRGDQQYTYDKNRNPLVFVWYDDYIHMTKQDIDEHIRNIRSIVRKVICLNDLRIFDTPAEAATFVGTSVDKIVRCCKAKVQSDNSKKLRFYCGKNPETREWLSWMFLYNFQHLSDNDKQKILDKLEHSNRDDIRTVEIYCLNSLELFASVKKAAQCANLACQSNISNACRKNGIGKIGRHPTTQEPLYWFYKSDYQKLDDVQKNELKNKYFTGNLLKVGGQE